MTNVIILGSKEKEKKVIKPIVFELKLVEPYKDCIGYATPTSLPAHYKNIELICRNYLGHNYDLMFAYDGERNHGMLYLGYFNDGVV